MATPPPLCLYPPPPRTAYIGRQLDYLLLVMGLQFRFLVGVAACGASVVLGTSTENWFHFPEQEIYNAHVNGLWELEMNVNPSVPEIVNPDERSPSVERRLAISDWRRPSVERRLSLLRAGLPRFRERDASAQRQGNLAADIQYEKFETPIDQDELARRADINIFKDIVEKVKGSTILSAPSAWRRTPRPRMTALRLKIKNKNKRRKI